MSTGEASKAERSLRYSFWSGDLALKTLAAHRYLYDWKLGLLERPAMHRHENIKPPPLPYNTWPELGARQPGGPQLANFSASCAVGHDATLR